MSGSVAGVVHGNDIRVAGPREEVVKEGGEGEEGRCSRNNGRPAIS